MTASPTRSPGQLLTTKEAAAYVGVSERQLGRMAGELPEPQYIGHDKRYYVVALDEWLAERQAAANREMVRLVERMNRRRQA